ncbi:penicillin acylase family protein [Oceanimonas sp. NS1]|nr:penicillin acylase family protein [Oceanimonas sp. NS1]
MHRTPAVRAPWAGTGLGEAPFSNILVLGKDKTQNASAVLINGPQFGFYQPAYTYSVGLHGAGYDVVGNSPPAMPWWSSATMVISAGEVPGAPATTWICSGWS